MLLSQDLSQLPFDVKSQRVIKYDGANPHLSRPPLRAALKTVLSSDRLAKSEHLFSGGHYRAAILESFMLLEVMLRQLAAKSGCEKPGLETIRPMGEVVRKLEKAKILGPEERKTLTEAIRIRNSAVHVLNEPSKMDASIVINATKQFLARFDADI